MIVTMEYGIATLSKIVPPSCFMGIKIIIEGAFVPIHIIHIELR